MKGRRIFISYAHEDYQIIQSISSSVKDSNDLIWLDRNFISPGDVWRDKIEKALKSSYCIIFFASALSVKSKEVKLEIDFALSLRKRVIPVLLEKCSLPYEVSNLHYISLTDRTQQEVEVFREILSGISSRKVAKPLLNKAAVSIVEDIKTSNNFYNKVIVPNRFIWTSTAVSVALLFFINYFLSFTKIDNQNKGDESLPTSIEIHDTAYNHVDTVRIKDTIPIPLDEKKHK